MMIYFFIGVLFGNLQFSPDRVAFSSWGEIRGGYPVVGVSCVELAFYAKPEYGIPMVFVRSNVFYL